MNWNKFSSEFDYIEENTGIVIKVMYAYEDGNIYDVCPSEYQTFEDSLKASVTASQALQSNLINDECEYEDFILNVAQTIHMSIYDDALLNAHDYIVSLFEYMHDEHKENNILQ